jgi:lysozyme family protein
MTVDAYIDSIIGREGGYTNNPADKGGETFWGITEYTARAYGYKDAMHFMSRAQAAAIYKSRYWIAPKFDQVEAIDSSLAEKLLDIGVNMGQATGVKFLQRALNVLNQQGKTYPDMTVDGGIGPMTLAAINALYALRGSEGRRVLLAMVAAQQSVRYIEIAEANPSQEVFEFGWQNARAFGVLS